ncbi:pumilio homolog 1-like isoform X2 [Apostichopus japonicus]|uniref:pumilio homolog 1-like isoform X2 n=1 Tax=Stichopus japonicus TaxID=307972 RepID=UPI003AB38617
MENGDWSSTTTVERGQGDMESSMTGARTGYTRAPQPRSRDDAAVGYFYQRPSNNDLSQAGMMAKHKWTSGDDSVIDQVRTADLSKMTSEFQALQLEDMKGRHIEGYGSPKKYWGTDDKGGLFLNQNEWSQGGQGAWGMSGTEHSVSQPIMVQRRQLSPGSYQGHENSVLSPRSDTSGLGLSMVEYVLGSSPRVKPISGEIDHKLHQMKNRYGINAVTPNHEQADSKSNQNKNSKTPSPYEEVLESHKEVQNGGEPLQVQNEDQSVYSMNNGQPPSSEPIENQVGQQQEVAPPHHMVDAQYQNGPVKGHREVPPEQYLNSEVPNQLEIDTGGGGPESGMEPLQFEYPGNNQMVQNMGSPGFVEYSQQQQMFQQRQPTPQQALALQQQQQQYAMAAAQQQQQQQQQMGMAPTFANPYIFTGAPPAQDPYTLSLAATMQGQPQMIQPQYAYGVAPWGALYPMNIVQQQGGAAQPNQPPQGQQQPGQQPTQQPSSGRSQNGSRPMTPQAQPQGQGQAPNDQGVGNSTPGAMQGIAQPQAFTAPGYPIMTPTYYDQSGNLFMGGPRPGLGTPVRLMPHGAAPVMVSGAQQIPTANGYSVMMANQAQAQAQQQQAAAQQGQQGSMTHSGMSMYTNGAAAAAAQMQSNPTSGGGMGSFTAQSQNSGAFGSGTFGGLGNSMGPIGTGAGIGSSGTETPTQRRDSFSGATGEYKRSLSMSQFYGSSPQLGTFGMSPTHTGSMTPPPTQSTLSGLGLDHLLGSATGSWSRPKTDWGDVKYRSGSTSSTGSAGWGSSSLFPPRSLRSSAYMEKSAPGRSRLLEDFRNNRFPNLQLRDLLSHFVEFSQDQHGSRFIQQKLERATPQERQIVFQEIIGSSYKLMNDVFGNYVIQKFFEFGTPEQKKALAQRIKGSVLQLALQMYGCRVIQKALESITADLQVEMVKELDGHVLKCVKDQNGNHVVQKCIECVDPVSMQFIVEAFRGQVYSLSTHPYGCRVIQRILEHCTPEQTKPILDELHSQTEALVQDQYGNYVIQHVLEHGRPEDKSKIVAEIRGKVLVLSQHKFASNAVEKCITHSCRPERAILIDEVCSYNDGSGHSALFTMMKDQYANYVVQKMIDVSEPNQRKVLIRKIQPYVIHLRKYPYGKHILAKLEKFFMKNNEINPFVSPPNGTL